MLLGDPGLGGAQSAVEQAYVRLQQNAEDVWTSHRSVRTAISTLEQARNKRSGSTGNQRTDSPSARTSQHAHPLHLILRAGAKTAKSNGMVSVGDLKPSPVPAPKPEVEQIKVDEACAKVQSAVSAAASKWNEAWAGTPSGSSGVPAPPVKELVGDMDCSVRTRLADLLG